jgi:hypothetical protein
MFGFARRIRTQRVAEGARSAEQLGAWWSAYARDTVLRGASALVKEVGEVPAELVLGQRGGNDEVGWATLTVRADQERRPITRRALDDHELAEDVEAVLPHLSLFDPTEDLVPQSIGCDARAFGYSRRQYQPGGHEFRPDRQCMVPGCERCLNRPAAARRVPRQFASNDRSRRAPRMTARPRSCAAART